MNNFTIAATSQVSEADVASARLGTRFGRMDLASQLALLAVEKLGVDFGRFSPGRVAICLAARIGSLSTDINFWNGRNDTGGPSPTLFAYTLPSAAIGEIAIRHKLTGPNLCLVGGSELILPEAEDLLRRGEADAVLGIYCEAISPESAKLIRLPPAASAKVWFLEAKQL